jgi:TRAP-type uncharacterized transport system fused permease subunit
VRAYKGRRLRLGELAGLLSSTGLGTFRLILIVAAAGFVIGILNITGLGFGLTLALVKIAGSSLIAILLISAVICIILGMGMPTSGVYVLLAALVAPAIVETGAPDIAAHMFIFYFGMLSMITPPIAIAAFTAATISGASPMATGFAAVRIGWVAYVVPFLFVFSPTLLLLGDDTIHVITDLVTAASGVFLTTAALVGYVASPLSAPGRVALAISGLAAMTPLALVPHAEIVNAAGLVAGAAICGWSVLQGRRMRAATG